MSFRVYLWNLTTPPSLKQSSNKYNCVIFTSLKQNLCNSKGKKDTQFAWAHAFLFSWSISILLINICKNSWESLRGWVSKEFILTPCLFDRLAYKSHFQLQRLVLLLFSLRGGYWKFGCKILFDLNMKYIYMHICVFSLEALKISCGQCSEISQEYHWLCVFPSFCIL